MSELTNSNSNDEFGFTSRTITLRNERGLTQQQFAEKINVSAVLVSDIERRKKKLSLQNAIEIRRIFNVSLDWLYELSNDTNDTASNIINNLRNVFRIDFENKTISVDEDLAEFLDKLFNAYKIKEEKGMPSEALKYWIDGIKNEYNEKIKNRDMFDTNKVIPKYYLQDYREHKIESAPHIPF